MAVAERRGRAARGVRAGPGLRRAHVRRPGDPARAVLPQRTPRRGADPRPGRRPGRRAGRARLLGAAAQPEGRRRRRPSPGVTPELRARMLAAAVRAGEAVGYRNAGTVECLVDPTRAGLRVPRDEHPAAGRAPGHRAGLPASTWWSSSCSSRRASRSASTRTRSCRRGPRHRAADQRRGPQALPARPGAGSPPGRSRPATGVRVDSGYAAGNTVTPHYDSLMAKLVVHGADRDQALERARAAVAAFNVEGPKCNLAFFAELLENAGVRLRSLRHRPGEPHADSLSRRRGWMPVERAGGEEPRWPRKSARRWSRTSGRSSWPRATRSSDGDTLVILESMKMEIPVLAESAGTVLGAPCGRGRRRPGGRRDRRDRVMRADVPLFRRGSPLQQLVDDAYSAWDAQDWPVAAVALERLVDAARAHDALPRGPRGMVLRSRADPQVPPGLAGGAAARAAGRGAGGRRSGRAGLVEPRHRRHGVARLAHRPPRLGGLRRGHRPGRRSDRR